MKYFTKSQINEISSRLATDSVRDSDLDEIQSIDGSEYIAVEKDGQLVRVQLSVLMDYLDGGSVEVN